MGDGVLLLSLSLTLSRRGGYEKAVLLDVTLKISSGAGAKPKEKKREVLPTKEKLTFESFKNREINCKRKTERERVSNWKRVHTDIYQSGLKLDNKENERSNQKSMGFFYYF